MRAIVLMVGLLLVTGLAEAGKVYRWTDVRGQVHYSDRPGEGARDIREVNVKLGSATAEAVPQEDAQVVEARRVAACTTKRNQLQTYEMSVRLVEKSSLGVEREFTAEERELLLAKTRGEVDQLCADLTTEPEG